MSQIGARLRSDGALGKGVKAVSRPARGTRESKKMSIGLDADGIGGVIAVR